MGYTLNKRAENSYSYTSVEIYDYGLISIYSKRLILTKSDDTGRRQIVSMISYLRLFVRSFLWNIDKLASCLRPDRSRYSGGGGAQL